MTTNATLDETDRRLIALLRSDARLPASSLAAELGVSRSTVQNRIERLKRDGLLLGFTVRLKPQAEPAPVRAITMIEVQGKAAEKVLKTLRGFPEIATLHTTNGRWDIVAELHSSDLEAFDKALNRLRLVEGIAHTETSLLLSTYK